MDIDVEAHFLIVVAAYPPTDNATAAEKDSFFLELTTTLAEIGNWKKVFLIDYLKQNRNYLK